jgi:tetratricopeptide (TPR) repeat protein
VQRVLDAWQSPMPRLLIFDNCEDETLLRDWRQPGGCRVLVTSRRAQWAPALGVQALALGELKHMESVQLLCNYRSDLALDDADLHAIAHELGNLPLALHLAGSYLRRYQRTETPAAYLHHLRSPALLEHRSMIGWRLTQELSPTKHEEHVVRTFAISYDQLKVDDPIDVLARGLLARAAYFAPGEPIPHALLLLTMGFTTDDDDAMHDAEDALARLVNLGLLEEAADGGLRLHRLVAAFVCAVTNDADAQGAVEDAMLNVASYFNGTGDPRPLLALQPHLRAITEAAQQRGDELAASLSNALGYHLNLVGDYTGAQRYYEQALDIRQQVLGRNHPDTATSLDNLGNVLHDQGDLAGARHYFEQALVIWQQVRGRNHLDTAISLNNLGGVLHTQGELADAQRYYEQALAIRRQKLGMKHPNTATSLNNLGSVLHEQSDLVGARRYLEQALVIWQQVLKNEHPNIALSLRNLGLVLRDLGDLISAQRHLEQALKIAEQVFGLDHPTTQIIQRDFQTLDVAPQSAAEQIASNEQQAKESPWLTFVTRLRALAARVRGE